MMPVRRDFFRLVLAAMTGMVLSYAFFGKDCFLFSAVLFFYMVLFLAGSPVRNRKTAVFSVVFLLAGGTAFYFADNRPAVFPETGTAEAEIIRVSGRSAEAFFRGEDGEKEKVLLFFSSTEEVFPGDVLDVEYREKPADSPGNPGEFDFVSYYRFRGIGRKFFVEGVTARKGTVFSPARLAGLLQHKFDAAAGKILSPEKLALSEALLFGDRSGLDDETGRIYGRGGFAHLLSVSGLHGGILAAAFYFFWGLFRLPPAGRIPASGLLLAFYCVMSGLNPPIVRAAIMIFAGGYAFLKCRYRDVFSIMAMSAFCYLLFNPLALFTASFQLSYGAVLSLVLFYAPVEKKLGFLTPRIRGIVAASLAVQVLAAPVALYYFHYFPLLFLLTNLLFIPLVTVLVPLLFLAFLFSFIPFMPVRAALLPAGAVMDVMGRLTGVLGGIPGQAAYRAAGPSLGELAVYYIIIFILCSMGKIRRKTAPALRVSAACLCAAVLLVHALAFPVSPGFYFLDVGQGDGALFVSPAGETVIVDGGRDRERMKDFLQAQGIRTVDWVFLSHIDGDHSTGIMGVLESLETERVVLTEKTLESEEAGEFRELLSLSGAEVIVAEKGDVFSGRAFRSVVLSPEARFEGKWDPNEASLVFVLESGGDTVLYTGDVKGCGTEELCCESRDIDVIKVPHHGGSGSDCADLYDAFTPETAVISVGLHNRYGHPGEETIRMLEDRGILLLRTDLGGCIFIPAGKMSRAGYLAAGSSVL